MHVLIVQLLQQRVLRVSSSSCLLYHPGCIPFQHGSSDTGVMGDHSDTLAHCLWFFPYKIMRTHYTAFTVSFKSSLPWLPHLENGDHYFGFLQRLVFNFKNENISNVCSLSQDFGLLQGLIKIFEGWAEIRPCVKKKARKERMKTIILINIYCHHFL